MRLQAWLLLLRRNILDNLDELEKEEACKSIRFPGRGATYKWLGATLWVLRTELGSSWRAANAFSHWAITPASSHFFLFLVHTSKDFRYLNYFKRCYFKIKTNYNICFLLVPWRLVIKYYSKLLLNNFIILLNFLLWCFAIGLWLFIKIILKLSSIKYTN